MTDVLVTGAGGFIGGHLVKRLLDEGERVVALDIKHTNDWYQSHSGARNVQRDASQEVQMIPVFNNMGVSKVYNLAADMGGMGFIETHKADCMLSVLINTNMLRLAKYFEVEKYLYTSSACVYAAGKQDTVEGVKLAEADAYPADAEDGYGWEKLFSERMCRHFYEDYGLSVRVPRLHAVYGPEGTWTGGREKAPAAISRKVAEAKRDGAVSIDIWGDGLQTRSFMYVDDCVEGFIRLMASDYTDPINLGSEELTTINNLVDVTADIAGIELEKTHDLTAPQGVRGRCSDNALIREVLGWEPSISLRSGMERTYEWVAERVNEDG
jgi:nucleoside-diphosphate-sugar epimerase